MKKTVFLTVLNLVMAWSVQAQFLQRGLNKDLPSDAFVKMMYLTDNDSIVTGFGFPDPVVKNRIVYAKQQPEGEITQDWKSLRVKYAEFYYNEMVMLTRDLVEVEYSTDAEFLSDTLRVYPLRIKGAVANGLKKIGYENEAIQMFEDFYWDDHFFPSQLVYVRTQEEAATDASTFALNYNNERAFKRSAKRFFKACDEVVQKIEAGAYFPKSKKNIKALADDYAAWCAQQ